MNYNAQALNVLREQYAPDADYRFVDQDELNDARYYEEIIFHDKLIPTRKGSLHDCFNGLIWLRFGQTKSLLNTLHCQDIASFGLKKRSPRRDRITHFDECGLVLVSDIPELKQRISEHDWHWLFIEKKEQWFASKNGIVPLHFGHANLEMLCQPFIGLTAKALILQRGDLLASACTAILRSNPIQERLMAQQQLDSALAEFLTQQRVFEQKSFLPLPLLGVPGWHNDHQDAKFYANTDYFMPHPSLR